MKASVRLRRSGELAVKAGNAALREVAFAPEQRAARRLTASVAAAAPSPDGRKVMFLTPRSWAAHVQWEAVIAQSLRLRGADVRFLTCGGGLGVCDRSNTWESPPPPCRSCSKYVDDSLAAHGFERTELSDHWNGRVPSGGQGWPELDGLALADLVDVEYHGLPLGRLVEIPVKWFLLRADLTGDPLAARTYRAFLRSARSIADALTVEIDRFGPDVAVLCNGLFLFEAVAGAICERSGIDVVTYERGLIKETLLFRRNAIACLMDFTPFWPEWADRPLTDAEASRLDDYLDERRLGRRTIDRYWDEVSFSHDERSREVTRVTLLPNLTWDSAVIGQSAAYDGLEPWIRDTIELVAHRAGVHLTIRVHPAETKLPGKQTREPVQDLVARHFPDLPDNVSIIGPDDPTSTYTVLEDTDLVLVFSSTTGLEASMMGKPVIVAGQTHYRGKGFTVDAEDPSDYEFVLGKALADPAAYRPDVDLARRYAYLLFFRAPVDCPGAEEHVLGLARLTVSTADDLRPGADESLDRICEGILLGRDFGPLPPS